MVGLVVVVSSSIVDPIGMIKTVYKSLFLAVNLHAAPGRLAFDLRLHACMLLYSECSALIAAPPPTRPPLQVCNPEAPGREKGGNLFASPCHLGITYAALWLRT
jgi:hypothetical protein